MQKANMGCEIHGKLPIKQLKRLNESLLSGQGDVDVSLKFARAGHIPYIEGHIKTQLQLKCQRCMQAMPFAIDESFKIGLVLTEKQAEDLPDTYEAYLVEEDNNHLHDLLEDEMLLALPLVAMHEFECSEYLQQQSSVQESEVKQTAEKENPFSVLKDLL